MDNKKTIPSLASLCQNSNASGNSNNLTQLKAKMQQNKSPSLSSLASSATKKPLTSLQSLATRSTTANSPSLSSLAQKSTTINKSKLTSLSHLASKKDTDGKNTILTPAVQIKPNTISISNPPVKTHDIEEEIVNDPLCGKPSAVAQFLFKPTNEHVFDAQQVFQRATQKPTSIPIFKFDQPSPDDIVLAAQSQRSGPQKKNS